MKHPSAVDSVRMFDAFVSITRDENNFSSQSILNQLLELEKVRHSINTDKQREAARLSQQHVSAG